MNGEPTVTIERWRSVYSVAADFPAPEELCSRLDRMVEGDLVNTCRSRLTSLLDASDESVWLIREIQIDLAVDASRNAVQQAGTTWGEQLAMEIWRVLDGGASGGSAVRFANPTAYVAQWTRDMAAGCAWEKWYYSEFASLRSLPRGAAIAEGILRERGQAKRILHLLRVQNGLEPVLDALTNADARRLYESLLPGSGPQAVESGRWASRLLALWSGIALSGASSSWHDALRLYTAATEEWAADSAGSSLRSAIDGVLDLRRLFSSFANLQMAQRFLQAAVDQKYEVAHEILTACGVAVNSTLIDFVACASGGDQSWAGFAAAVISPSQSAEAIREESFVSELGGVFLLGASFIDLNIQAAVCAAARSCEDPLRAEAALRYLLAVRCMGRARASLAISDAALALFANTDGRLLLSEMAEVLTSADAGAALRIVAEMILDRGGEDPEGGLLDEHLDFFAISEVFPELQLDADCERVWSRIAAALIRDFARRLSGFARSSPEYVFENFLEGTSSVRIATAESIEVRLPQSPLAVVLRIAGAYRTLSLPWREGVEICLLAP